MSSNQDKNPERVVAGLKATIKRRGVSKEAKARAQERLQEMGVEFDKPASTEKKPRGRKQKSAVEKDDENEQVPEAQGDDEINIQVSTIKKRNKRSKGKTSGMEAGEDENIA